MRVIAALVALAAWTGIAHGQDTYPSKPVRILVGYAAGGGNDIIVRVLQPRLQAYLGQPVIVENKPGAPARSRSCAAPTSSAAISSIPPTLTGRTWTRS